MFEMAEHPLMACPAIDQDTVAPDALRPGDVSTSGVCNQRSYAVTAGMFFDHRPGRFIMEKRQVWRVRKHRNKTVYGVILKHLKSAWPIVFNDFPGSFREKNFCGMISGTNYNIALCLLPRFLAAEDRIWGYL